MGLGLAGGPYKCLDFYEGNKKNVDKEEMMALNLAAMPS